MFAILAGRPTASHRYVVPTWPRTPRSRSDQRRWLDRGRGAGCPPLRCARQMRGRPPDGDRTDLAKPSRPLILTAGDFDGVDDRFVAGIQTSLHVDEEPEY